jgi:hypothetical protein
MRIRHLFLVFVALGLVAAGQICADEKSAKATKTAELVQSSPDQPDRSHKGSVTGLVTDKTGNAVGEAKVELIDPVTKEPPLSIITDKKGRYIFSGLLPGSYKIQAKKDAMQSDLADIKVSSGSNAGPKLILIPR